MPSGLSPTCAWNWGSDGDPMMRSFSDESRFPIAVRAFGGGGPARLVESRARRAGERRASRGAGNAVGAQPHLCWDRGQRRRSDDAELLRRIKIPNRGHEGGPHGGVLENGGGPP